MSSTPRRCGQNSTLSKRELHSNLERKPVAPTPELDAIPEELCTKRRWLLWRYEVRGDKWSKLPSQTNGEPAKTNDPATWTTFEEVRKAYQRCDCDGIGFVLGDGISGIDLDDVREPSTGEIKPEAKNLIDRFATYTEVSPSGTGIKMIGRGVWPDDWHRKPIGKGSDQWEIEGYHVGRYFTITGQAIERNQLCNIQPAIDATIREYGDPKQQECTTQQREIVQPDESDNVLFEKAEAATNGEKFRRLRNGDTSEYGGDESRADLVYCGLLAFWTGPDANRIDRLFRESRLMRPKWDELRGKQTYGERTIQKVIERQTEFYDWSQNGKVLSAKIRDLPSNSDRKVRESVTPSANGTPHHSKDIVPTADQPLAKLVSRSLSEITETEIEWLWPGRIPFGMFTVLDGDPAHGKSLITLDIAARLSSCSPMPMCDRPRIDASNVLIVAAEDAIDSTIKPRCRVASGDMDRIRVSETIMLGKEERPIRFPDDFDLLEKEIQDHKIRLVIIDPVLGFLNPHIDSHKDQSIRDVLHAVKLLAAKTCAAFVGIRHLSKSGGNGNALYRGMGSIAITAAARSALTVDWHLQDEGVRVLATSKCNLVDRPRSLAFQISDCAGQPVINWQGECDVKAADLGLKITGRPGGSRIKATVFLNECLSNGPATRETILNLAVARGISERTLYRASEELGIVRFTEGFPAKAKWKLPEIPE